jgi:hypothetical protein
MTRLLPINPFITYLWCDNYTFFIKLVKWIDTLTRWVDTPTRIVKPTIYNGIFWVPYVGPTSPTWTYEMRRDTWEGPMIDKHLSIGKIAFK